METCTIKIPATREACNKVVEHYVKPEMSKESMQYEEHYGFNLKYHSTGITMLE
jgi:hypothetical protein